MTGSALFFMILGVCVTVVRLMKLVLWLDMPHHAHSRTSRCPAPHTKIVDFSVAELSLERAHRAA